MGRRTVPPKYRVSHLAYLLAAPFETGLALAVLISSIWSLIHPDPMSQATIARAAKGLLPFWEALYAGGGFFTLLGLWTQSIRVEIAGLSLFTAAMVVQVIALVDVAGSTALLAIMEFGALSFGCVGRMVALVRAQKLGLRIAAKLHEEREKQ